MKFKNVNLNRNSFSSAGVRTLIKYKDEEDSHTNLETLNLSECSLDDDALESLSPLVDVVKELIISDNKFTRYITELQRIFVLIEYSNS